MNRPITLEAGTLSLNDTHEPSLFHTWFVQYNPLYFFSALCVLSGVFLTSQALGDLGWSRASILLAGVMELYQLLLIVGAVLLYRVADQRRPAVILGIMQVAVLLDPTFQTESMGLLGALGFTSAAAWVVLTAAKLMGLIYAFGLRVPATAFLVPLLAGMGIALGPALLNAPGVNREIVHLAMLWYGMALMLLVRVAKPALTSIFELDEWGDTVLRRVSKAIWVIWGVFFLLHLTAWAVQFDIPLTGAHAASFLILIALLVTRELAVWFFSLMAIAVGLLSPAVTFAPTMFVLALVLICQALRLDRARLWVGATLACHTAIWTLGWTQWPLPLPALWLTLATTAALFFIAFRMKSHTGWIAACAVLLLGLMPNTPLEWGITVILSGFISLVIGIAINWDQRHLSL